MKTGLSQNLRQPFVNRIWFENYSSAKYLIVRTIWLV